jgi:hypothetical protein
MSKRAGILDLAQQYDSDALQVLKAHIDEEPLYPRSAKDAIDIHDGKIVVCRVRLRPLVGKLITLAPALHGSAIGVLASVLAFALQLRSRESLPLDASQVCLLLGYQGAVQIDELYARTSKILQAEGRELSRELFDHILDVLQTNNVVRFVEVNAVELAESLEL